VLWGGAASADVAYYGLTGGGVAAMRINDGQRLWYSRFGVPEAQTVSHGAATTAIPGVLFLGGSDGRFNAVSSQDGSLLWQFDTNIEFDAVNKVPTHGGSISSAGATVVDGRVFVGSGYSVLGGIPGNALLMFERD
jgi:outer membrane protein assembly factor BamB